MTWMWWAYASGRISGSNASSSTPRATSQAWAPCTKPCWRRPETMHMPSPLMYDHEICFEIPKHQGCSWHQCLVWLIDWLVIFLDFRFPPTCHAQFPCSLDLMTRERWTSSPSFISLHPISLLVVVLDYSLRSRCFNFRRAGWTLRSKRTLPRKKATLMRRLRRSECLLIHQILFITRLFSLPLACLLSRDTARLIIRKIQYAPTQVGAGPKAEICKNFMMSDKPVQMEASLEKDVRYPNENVPVFPRFAIYWLL